MSKIFKASDIVVDKNNRVSIAVMPAPEPEPIKEEKPLENNIVEIPEELKASQEKLLKETEIIIQKKLKEAEMKTQEIMQSAEEEKAAIIEQAQIEGEDLRLKAIKIGEEEAETIREDARKKGYDDGMAIGVKKGEEIKEEALKIREDAVKYKEELIESTEPEIVELILGLVKKLVSDEVDINPDVVLLLIKKGLRQATMTGDISVHISKEDFEHAVKNKNSILATVETMANIEFMEDMALSKGQCIIETSFGSINCNIEDQYRELKKNMYFILKNR